MDTAIGIVLSKIEDQLTFNEIKKICFNCGITENEIINLSQATFDSNRKLLSKIDLINEIINILKKKEISEQQKRNLVQVHRIPAQPYRCTSAHYKTNW